MLNPDTQELIIVPVTCKKWTCSYCAPIRLRQVQRKARAGRPERHIVLTLRPIAGLSQKRQVAYIRVAFRRLVTQARKTFSVFEYMCALELHESGSPHLHILQRGTYISQRWLSKAWRKITGSYIVHIKQITNTRAAINELTKYLAKTASALDAIAPGRPPFTTSNNWLPDEDDADPAHNEDNWITYYCRVSIRRLADALDTLGVDVVSARGPPGRFSLSPRSDFSPAVLADRRRQAYREEDKPLALAVSLLNDPNYVTESADLAYYHKSDPSSRESYADAPYYNRHASTPV